MTLTWKYIAKGTRMGSGNKFLITGLLVCLTSYCSPEMWGQDGNVTPDKISSPPVINGKLDDKCWETIQTIKGFIPHQSKSLSQDTEVQVGMDSENLYLGIVCHEDQPGKLVKSFKSHDDPVFTDDSIEIFITPDYFQQAPIFHFIVNCIGTTYDSCNGEPGWNSNMLAASAIGDKQWTLEIKIPFADIGLINKDLFGISVCRERWGVKEWSIWPLGGAFHRPEGHLVLSGYKNYLKGILWEWQKDKEGVITLISQTHSVDNESAQKALKLIAGVDREIIAMFPEKELSASQFNIFIGQLKTAKQEIRALERKMGFMRFTDKLKKTILGEK